MNFIKHPFEKFKLIKQMNAIEEQWHSKKHSYKNHVRAKTKGLQRQKEVNRSIETLYHIAIKKMKLLFSKLDDKEMRVIVEMNLKEHALSVDELYSITLSTFFFDLQCDFTNNYWINYKFHKCPIEKEISEIMHQLSLTFHCREDRRIEDYPVFYERVLRVQPERFIYLL